LYPYTVLTSYLSRLHFISPNIVSFPLSHETRPSLPPPLFPYTTLFRSTTAGHGDDSGRVTMVGATGTYVQTPAHRYRDGADHREDRKSTRLNSSHVSISYAVFCLKKKKIRQFESCAAIQQV